MYMAVRRLVFVLALMAAVPLVGCGDAPLLDGTSPVTGLVTYQGQPVEGATVVFTPEGEGRAASGRTDASGRFEMTTLSPGDGVFPGKYRCAISKTEVTGGATREEVEQQTSASSTDQTPAEPTVRELLPEKYKSPATSGLTAEVTESGPNDIVFDLVD